MWNAILPKQPEFSAEGRKHCRSKLENKDEITNFIKKYVSSKSSSLHKHCNIYRPAEKIFARSLKKFPVKVQKR